MKTKFLFLALLISMFSCAQMPSRASGGIILGDPIGTSGDPTGVRAGQIYWNQTLLKFRQYDGTVWSDLGVPTIPNREMLYGTGTGIASNPNIIATNAGTTGYITLKSTSETLKTTTLYNNRIEVRDTNAYGSLYPTNLRFYNGTAFSTYLYAPTTPTADVNFRLPAKSVGDYTIATTSDITGASVEELVTPIDAFQGNRISPVNNINGFLSDTNVNGATGYLSRNTSVGASAYSGFAATNGDLYSDGVSLTHFNSGYFANYLRNNSLLSATNDLIFNAGKNTSDISFRLGNTASFSLTESGTDAILNLNANRTIVAPSLTTALIDAEATGKVLTTKEWIAAQGFGVADWSEFMTSSGTRAGGDLVVTIGDYDGTGSSGKIVIDDANLSNNFYAEGVEVMSMLGIRTSVNNEFWINSGYLNVKDAESAFRSSISPNGLLTGNRSLTLPDASGEIALTSDLTSYAPLVSPTFTTPSLGVATATSINGATITSGTLNGSVTGTNTGDDPFIATTISGQTLKTTLAGTEEVLINDAGTLKKTTAQDIADLGGGGSSVIKINTSYSGFSGRYYLQKSTIDDSATTFYQTAPDNLGTIWNSTVVNSYSGYSVMEASTVTSIKLNYSTLFAETYTAYVVVKRVPAGVETNTVLWTSADIVTSASSVGNSTTTGLSISLQANDRLFFPVIRTATTEGTATGITLSIELLK
jgi:hypothetical protein